MEISRGFIRLFVTGLVIIAASAEQPVVADIIYDFSLPANGSVGAIDIQLDFSAFVPSGEGLSVYHLDNASDPIVSFTSVISLDASTSAVGIDVEDDTTVIGLELFDMSENSVLFNPTPGDFFVFDRAPDDTGSTSGSGGVTSSYSLDTSVPTGTLDVTNTVPEPSTGALACVASVIGLAGAWVSRIRAAQRR
jgi:hypothetical protein